MISDETRWTILLEVAGELEAAGIAATLIGPAALWAQGIDVGAWRFAQFDVQWDGFETAWALLGAEPRVGTEANESWVEWERAGLPITISCRRNTVVAANPFRILIERAGRRIWVESLYARREDITASDAEKAAIEAFLQAQQRALSAANRQSWDAETYDSWVARFGPPAEAAARLRADPAGRLAALLRHLGPLDGRRVAHLLGSHGVKGVALALLGAQVTVVDSAPENARYARDLAAAAGVALRYVVGDVLDLPGNELSGDYDLVLLELGVLHYFVDLAPPLAVVEGLLAPGGRFVLHEFHPVSTKLISSKGRKHNVDGNYFDPTLQPAPVAHSKHRETSAAAPQVLLRRWTLGEVVTATASAGLRIVRLDEEPNTKADDRGLPKTFTLVAER